MILGLSLFSGMGGLDVALSKWVRPVAYCEIDPYCQAILLSRMGENKLPNAPIWDDIRNLSHYDLPRDIDIIYGGFPCQDISCAGAGKGLEGQRSGLFFEIYRLAKEIKPKFLFLENVPAITSRGGISVVRYITALGYDCRWHVVSAASVGASHKRERFFLLAHSQSERLQEGGQPCGEAQEQSRSELSDQYEPWRKEPESKLELAGMAHGLSRRVDRVKALGNAVVPQQAKAAFKILMGL